MYPNVDSWDEESSPESTIRIVVDVAEEHLGHNVNESNGHSIWCDGCRAHELVSGDPFVIYWTNFTSRESRHSFVSGASYEVTFEGALGSGVMGFEGKCIDIDQVKQVKEL
jgi:hypothetical protein